MATDADVLREVQQHLLEEPGAVFGSGLWTVDEFRTFLSQRIHGFQKETAVALRQAYVQVPQGVRLAELPPDWVLTAALTWWGEDGKAWELARGSSWEIDCNNGRGPGRPILYNDQEQELHQVAVSPVPKDQGVLDLLYAGYGPVVGGVGSWYLDDLGGTAGSGAPFLDPDLLGPFGGQSLMLPDELVPYLKWGVLADLLGKLGRGQDPARAAYCEARFQEGILLVHLLLQGWA